MTTPHDQPTAPLPLVGPGRVLAGRYELASALGSGGMALVFLARDRVLDRDVAVKVLREEYAADPVFRARFTREALHAASLSHPGLVTIFDAGVDQGTAFIVMEVVSGRTLQQELTSQKPLSVEQSVSIAADVCEVLDVAHRAGVVHRDIKPGNILLSDDGRTRVFDFGIARTDGSEALTETAAVIGTAAYISPEQAAGRPAEPRSDLYAVGCVLVEMLTGSPPFTADTAVALLHQHINDLPIPPSSQRPEVSSQLDAVALHLLAKDPADRPSTAAQARQDLLASASPPKGDTRVLPTAAPTTASTTMAPASPRRPARAAVVALVVLVAATALGLLAVRQGQKPSPASAPAATNSPTSSTTPSTPRSESPSPSAVPALLVPSASSVPQALAVLRSVIATGGGAALIDPDAAAQLLDATDEVAGELDKANGKSAVPRVRRLATLVDAQAGAGQIAASAVAPLQAAIDQLLRLVEGSQ